MRSLLVMALWLAATSCVAAAESSSMFASSPCLTQQAAAGLEQCQRLAREVSHDIRMVRTLGEELERAGRHADAASVYEVAITVHPNNRDLLQGLIRARGMARSTALLAPPRPSGASTPPPPQPPPTQSAGRYFALLIANEAYRNFTPLRSPITDVQAMSTVLDRNYGFTVRTLQNATRYEMLSALSQLRREATQNDHILIYYAGHGYLDEATSRGYWLPVDAERDNVANWVSTGDITDALAGSQAKHALILADSCFSGTLLRSDPTVEIDERQSLLQRLASRRSRNIMTSGGLEPVTDTGAGKHSIFAGALLRALRANRAPIEAGRLFVQIRDHVALNAEQTPQYAPLRNAGHDGGDFIFAPRKH